MALFLPRAITTDMAMNSRQNACITRLVCLSLILGKNTPRIKSMLMVEAEASTSELSVDMEAESTSTTISPSTSSGMVFISIWGMIMS